MTFDLLAGMDAMAVRETSPPPSEGPASPFAVLAQGLDFLSYGIAVFDARGRTVYANAAAEALLDGLAAPAPGSAGTPAVQAGARAVLQSSLERACGRVRRELVLLPTADAGLPVALLPLCQASQRYVMAVFGREEICGSIELLMFARAHKITHAEVRVLDELSRGRSPRAIADALGVGLTTVRAQISSVRSKTAQGNMRKVLNTLSMLPPLTAVSVQRPGLAH